MKRIYILFMFLFAVNIAAQINNKSKSNHDPVVLTISEIKSKISYNLELLEREYLTKLSYRDYIRAKDVLIDSYNLLMTIPDEDEYQYNEPLPISEKEFSSLLNSVKNESFESDMISVVQISSQYNYYTVDQVIRLIDLFSFSIGKIEVIKMTYPNVVDKYNSHQIINAFNYSADKEKVRQIISSFPER